MKEVLLMMDSYAFYPRITFKQKEKYQTFIGLIFTFFSICLFIILISINIKKVFSRTHFNLISSLVDTNDILELKDIQLSFAILLNYEEFLPYNKSVITFELVQYFYEHDGKYNTTPIELFHCDEVSNSDYLSKSFDIPKDTLHNALCTEPNQKLYILPKAGTRSSIFSMLYLYIKKCNNSENSECIPEFYIDKNLPYFYLLVGYMTNNVDHYNYSNPIFKTPRYDAFFFSKDIQKDVNYYFQKNVYDSDDGLLFENKKNESYITFDRFFSEYNVKEENDIQYGSIQFFGNNYINYYQRNYIRIFDIVADVKSYVDIVYSVISIILFFVVRNMFYVNMIKCIYFNNDDLICKNINYIIYNEKENIKLNLRENVVPKKRKTNKPKTYVMGINKKNKQKFFNEKDEQSSKRKIRIKSKTVKLKKDEQKFNYKFYYYIFPLFLFKENKTINAYNKLYKEIINNISLENIYKYLYIDKGNIFQNLYKPNEKINNIDENYNEKYNENYNENNNI